MKVAIPVWGETISPVFDTAARLMIVDTGGDGTSDRTSVSLEGDDIARRCARMKELGVDTLICSAISNPFRRRLTASSIEVIQGISGPTEAVLKAYQQGNLYQEAFQMPGYHPGKKGHPPEKEASRKPCRKFMKAAAQKAARKNRINRMP